MRALPLAGVLLAASGCARPAMLAPGGPQAGHIDTLFWIMLGITGVIYVIVLVVLGLGIFGPHRAGADRRPPGGLTKQVVIGAVALTALTVLVLAAVNARTGRSLSSLAQKGALPIKVTGHQWWWEVEYEDASPSQTFTTANEIHVPVGVPVRLTLTSGDVIHSFWVPALNGKRDLFPGRTTELMIQADRPATYRGQCAEFCGHQHAHMAFYVIAEPPAQFDRWRRAQRAPAREPSNPEAMRGRTVFLAGPCVLCHTVRGTGAGGRMAPDLTHLAIRQTIAALTLPNTRGHLAGWILDPQGVKPGNKMPATSLAPDDLQAIVSYLRGLE